MTIFEADVTVAVFVAFVVALELVTLLDLLKPLTLYFFVTTRNQWNDYSKSKVHLMFHFEIEAVLDAFVIVLELATLLDLLKPLTLFILVTTSNWNDDSKYI